MILSSERSAILYPAIEKSVRGFLGSSGRFLFPQQGEDPIKTLLTVLAFVVPGNALNHMPMSWFKHKQVDRRWEVVRPYDQKLDRIAYCESTDRWYLDTGNGFYGGLQFTLSTWWSVGGRGYPNDNSILEQKYRAVLVHNRRGSWADWPVCGYR